MPQFTGTHQNRLDAKGRVSVPALFRSRLRPAEAEGAPMVALFRSPKFKCVEGWPLDEYDAMAASIETLRPFSDEHDDMATALFGSTSVLEIDKEGRIQIPQELVQYAGLEQQVAFLGVGRSFQIWEPDACTRRRDDAGETARVRGFTLPVITR